VTAYDPSEWSDFFVATAGASAALAGLLFVAISVNVDRILRYRGLPERGLETVLLLLGVLLTSMVALVPGQARHTLGIEILFVSAAFAVMIVRRSLRAGVSGEAAPAWLWGRWAVRLAGTVPLIVGGVSVAAGAGGGLYWVAAGMVLAVVGAVANAWVLLVEILR
jgi:modulator of FtsH protease